MRKQPYLPLLILLIALTARLLPGPRTIDDAYITFRYARNILAGDGMVYNPGEAVLGTTTPVYTGLMALLGLFTGGPSAPFPALSLILNALADAMSCLVLIRVGEKLNLQRAGYSAALIWAVLPFSVTFAIGGLETSVFVLLLLSTFLSYLESRFTLTALLASLSLLTRPDAALLLLPVGIDRLRLAMRRAGTVTFGEIAAFVLPLAAWTIPATLFFGSPIPHSLAAKAAAYNLPPTAALSRLVQHYATPFMEQLTFGAAGIAAGLFIYPTLSLIGAVRTTRQEPRAWPWLTFPWIWFAAYAIANPLIFRWYLTPPLPAYIFVILAGLSFIGRDLRNRFPSPLLQKSWLPALLFLPTLLVLRGWTLHPDHGLTTPAPRMAWYELELKYQEAAEFLVAHTGEMRDNPVLAAADIGALGYYTGLPILDTLGLISPQASNYYPTDPSYYINAYAVSPDLILDEQPDYMVLLEVYGRAGLFLDPTFNDNYELIHTVETTIYDSDGMLIFKKR